MHKWEQVLNHVLDDIQRERLAPGDRFYTLAELGEKYAVSTTTAQRVFRELAVRRVILTNRGAGTLVSDGQNGQTVFLCLRGEMFEASGRLDHFRAIDAFLEGLRNGGESGFPKVEPVALNFLLAHIDNFKGKPVLISANAFLDVTPTRIVINQDLFSRIREALNPIVFHGFDRLPGVTQLITDFYCGFRKVMSLLAERHSRIAFLTGDPGNIWYLPRFNAYMDGLREHALPFVPEWVRVTKGADKDADFRALDAILKAPEHPTALVCSNDLRALHAMEYCKRHGIEVPGNLAITGFDNLPESAVCQPPLTTCDGRNLEFGRKAAECLWKRMHGKLKEPADIWIEPELIVRESS